jgi:hypothetical protein
VRNHQAHAVREPEPLQDAAGLGVRAHDDVVELGQGCAACSCRCERVPGTNQDDVSLIEHVAALCVGHRRQVTEREIDLALVECIDDAIVLELISLDTQPCAGVAYNAHQVG